MAEGGNNCSFFVPNNGTPGPGSMPISHKRVYRLAVAPDGRKWFGTYGHGVSRYRPSTDLWDSYSAANGEMLAAYIFDISEDSAGRLLFSGYHAGGVAVFDQQLSYDVPPTLGQNFELTVAGTPGDSVLLLVSAVTADVQSAAWGTLLVDPTVALIISLGSIPASGELELSFPIPFDPTLPGTEPIYMQAFNYSSLGPAVGELTNRQSFVFVL